MVEFSGCPARPASAMTRLLRLLALVLAVGTPFASEASGVALAEGAGTTAQSYAYDLSLGATTHSADTRTVASASRSGRWRSPGVGCLVSGCCVATKGAGKVPSGPGARYPLSPKLQKDIGKRDWTTGQIDEAIDSGDKQGHRRSGHAPCEPDHWKVRRS